MNATARAAQLTLQNLDIAGIAMQEARVSGTDLSLLPDGGMRITDASATLIATEAEINRSLAGRTFGNVRDLEVATLTGRLRIGGRWSPVAHVWIPFKATGVPDIEGGARLRFTWQQISSVGGVPIPGVQMIGEYVNAQLAQMADATQLPLALRLTGLTVEPGRVILTAVASSLELHPPAAAELRPALPPPAVLE